jgi:dihydroorotate dehydrogenase (NAD+) catalytic subunit
MSELFNISLGRGLTLSNPVLLASGTVSYGEELHQLGALDGIGGIVTKAISLEVREGNLPSRMVETSAGVLNAIGLANVGIDRFINEKMPVLRTMGVKIIVNIVGKSVEDYVEVVRRLDDVEGIDGYEINLSCPNVKGECIIFGVSSSATQEMTQAIRKVTSRHVMIKLTPNVTSIGAIAKAAEEGGADSVSLINTVVGMAVDYKSQKPVLKNITGGLSGPAIKPIALAKVWECYQSVKIPIVGMGGISCYEDALEFLVVGSKAVQIGTMNFVQPNIGSSVAKSLQAYFNDPAHPGFDDMIGSLKV